MFPFALLLPFLSLPDLSFGSTHLFRDQIESQQRCLQALSFQKAGCPQRSETGSPKGHRQGSNEEVTFSTDSSSHLNKEHSPAEPPPPHTPVRILMHRQHLFFSLPGDKGQSNGPFEGTKWKSHLQTILFHRNWTNGSVNKTVSAPREISLTLKITSVNPNIFFSGPWTCYGCDHQGQRHTQAGREVKGCELRLNTASHSPHHSHGQTPDSRRSRPSCHLFTCGTWEEYSSNILVSRQAASKNRTQGK